MTSATLNVTLNEEVKKVWDIVTSLDNYAWRSDLSIIEVLETGKKFIEYTKEGYATTFIVTRFEPMTRYEFDMDNNNMYGHWIGIFSRIDDKTVVNFTENIMPKKWLIKPFVRLYLKKQQNTYIADLRKALEED